VVIDSRLILKPSARLFNGEAPTILATAAGVSSARINRLKRRGVTILACPPAQGGRGVNLKELLKTLGKMFISHLVVEGGGTLNASFVENKLVDEFFVFVAPKIFGGKDAKTMVEGGGVSSPARAWNLKWDSCRHIGDDLLLRATPI
jgi:diaminohydroxyphosphoribosylaminopyrimidine deaminase/5-amino-6-(5-phosphoribosylamino)uracil reductase